MTRKADHGEMKGQQRHAEGEHGPATRARIRQQVQEPHAERGEPGPGQEGRDEHEPDGTHRLFEGREQHDPADVQSDKNRLAKDVGRHGHERPGRAAPGGAGAPPAPRREPGSGETPSGGR